MGIPVNDDTEDVQPTSDQSEPFLYAILTESDSSDGTQGLLLAKTVPICVFDKEMLTEMAAGALFQAGETFDHSFYLGLHVGLFYAALNVTDVGVDDEEADGLGDAITEVVDYIEQNIERVTKKNVDPILEKMMNNPASSDLQDAWDRLQNDDDGDEKSTLDT
jgi:hypothetical protein